MRCVWTATILAALAVAAMGCRQEAAAPPAASQTEVAPVGQAQPKLPTVVIDVGGVPLEVEVADRDATRQRGYMYRERPVNSGMLFVYPREQMMGFIMQNVKFDIDIAFMDAGGKILQIERMTAFTVDPPRSDGSIRTWDTLYPVQYALEVAAGWFKEHGVGVGAQVKIPAELATKAKGDRR
jgi:uncharacterized membrane protein (UPF0127 family)